MNRVFFAPEGPANIAQGGSPGYDGHTTYPAPESIMVDGIEDIYQRLADGLHSALPDEWVTARAEAIFYPDSSDYTAEYISPSGRPFGCPIVPDVDSAFRDLRQQFQDAGRPLWGQAVFELTPDGKFDMKFGYENCDENGDTIWDAEAAYQASEQRRRRLTEGV